MNGTLNDYLSSIEDYIEVEDKIVTYKWLSKALKVHVNTAKQLLYAFTLKKNNKKLLVTYLIVGKENNDPGIKFYLVKEDDVDKVKQSLEVVNCYHVYSIQRYSNFDPKILYNADQTYQLSEEDKRFSSIRNGEVVKRCKAPENVSNPCDLGSAENKLQKKTTTYGLGKTEKKTIVDKLESKSEKPSNSPNKNAAEDQALSKRELTKKSPSKTTPPKKKTSPMKKNASSKGTNISALFSKQAATAALKKEAKSVLVNKEKEEAKENIKETVQTPIEVDNHSENDNSTAERTPVNKVKKNNKRKKQYKDDSNNKKRKRIKIVSDSESSDNETEEERELSPEPEPVQLATESDEEIIPPTPVEKGRKRVRKQVDRMYQDEEGFLVTEKKCVYESCSDDEMPAESNVEPKSKLIEASNNKTEEVKKDIKSGRSDSHKNKAKKKSPSNNKQQSITNFFKKK